MIGKRTLTRRILAVIPDVLAAALRHRLNRPLMIEGFRSRHRAVRRWAHRQTDAWSDLTPEGTAVKSKSLFAGRSR